MGELTRKILKTRELIPSRHQQVPSKKNLAEKQTDLAKDTKNVWQTSIGFTLKDIGKKGESNPDRH